VSSRWLLLQPVQRLLRLPGDEDPHPGLGRRREDHHFVPPAGRGGGHDNPQYVGALLKSACGAFKLYSEVGKNLTAPPPTSVDSDCDVGTSETNWNAPFFKGDLPACDCSHVAIVKRLAMANHTHDDDGMIRGPF